MNCGFTFWHACQFTWVVIPVMIVMLCVLGFPCFFLCDWVRRKRLESTQELKAGDLERGANGENFKAVPQKEASEDLLMETPEYACGRERLALFKQFNARGLDPQKLIAKYDADNSGTLEKDELVKLLQDSSMGNMKVSSLDISFVMQVADLDDSGSISHDEVMTAIRTWYAWSTLPKGLNRVFNRYGFGEGDLPPSEAWAGMLTDLNSGLQVSNEEAHRVRELAMILGASEDRATVTQLRQAVAAWYLQIGSGRKQGDGAGPAVNRHDATIGEKISNFYENMGAALNGDLHISSFTMAVLSTIVCILFLVMPFLNLVVAMKFQPLDGCEAPQMVQTLRYTGCFQLLFTVICLLMAFNIASGGLLSFDSGRSASQVIFLVMGLVMCIFEILGALQVSISRENNCGTLLWNYAHFVYVLAPMLFLMFTCCYFPCLMVDEFSKHAPDALGGNR
jgi:hypothetical protein